ncbi:FUSC family protein [Martelella alba]|uniref:FUSC family protein n=1 Tax=Martelella alba TaxID=2590451 RepID=A0A506UCI7_9HYPH|nr:FUSC family protein [Martelella alba]TPW30525.1 FUSC family protein [Martelella alba]
MTSSTGETTGHPLRFFIRAGFDPERFSFAARTAIAAVLALFSAFALGLDHPQWAAMTVFAASQPTRGQLVEKSLFRLVGTVVGAFAGVCLVAFSGGNPMLLVPGLALWIGLSTLSANVLRGFVSYGAILAGYSASMVALLDFAHPDDVMHLGLDRVATIATGIVAALVVGLIMIKRQGENPLHGRIRLLLSRVLQDMAFRLAREVPPKTGELPVLLSELSAIEDALGPNGAGSLRSHRFARAARGLLIAEVEALLWLRSGPSRSWPPAVSEILGRASAALQRSDGEAEARRILAEATAICGADSALGHVLGGLDEALGGYLGQDAGSPGDISSQRQVILHRDFRGAARAGLRSLFAMLLVGSFWVATGWQSGPFMLLGVSIMLTMFSTFENPARMMPIVFSGQCLGVVGALACRFLVWPHATSTFDMVAMMVPFILLGAPISSNRRSMPFGFDYSMVSLLLLKPSLPLTGDFRSWLLTGLAVVLAPAFAFIVYRLVFPVNNARRRDLLIAAMIRELRLIAASDNALEKRQAWRARFYHRLLRLLRYTDASSAAVKASVDMGLAILGLGNLVFRMHEWASDVDGSVRLRRAARLGLARVARIEAEPQRTAEALQRLSRLLEPSVPEVSRTMALAAGDIIAWLGLKADGSRSNR